VEKIIGTILPIGVMEDTGVVTALTSAIPEQITNMIITCTLLRPKIKFIWSIKGGEKKK